MPDSLKLSLLQIIGMANVIQFLFEELSLTYKREFAEYVADAKRAETRLTRLQKIIPMIKNGIGLNDKYR